jgi:tRNA/tmRNA/rRNA uracil-C5-methylase (TrmA/RlmC/RlmD family)
MYRLGKLSSVMVMIQPHFLLIVGRGLFFAADLSKDVSDQAWARQKYNKVMLDPSRAGASEVLHNLKKWDPELVMYLRLFFK